MLLDIEDVLLLLRCLDTEYYIEDVLLLAEGVLLLLDIESVLYKEYATCDFLIGVLERLR